MSPRLISFTDIPALAGQVFTVDSFRVTQDEVDRFEDVTGVTEIYRDSLATEYPDGMIEGFHSLSLIDWLLHRLVRVDPTECYSYNYGLDRVRFPSSMTIHDDLTFTAEVVAVEPRGTGYLLRYRCTIATVGAEKPGMVADWIGFALPRTSTAFKSPRANT